MTLVVWVREPDVPVMVIVYVPRGVPEAVVIVIVDEVPLAGLGLKPVVLFAGCPLAERVTEPAKPEIRVIVTVYCAVPPELRTD